MRGCLALPVGSLGLCLLLLDFDTGHVHAAGNGGRACLGQFLFDRERLGHEASLEHDIEGGADLVFVGEVGHHLVYVLGDELILGWEFDLGAALDLCGQLGVCLAGHDGVAFGHFLPDAFIVVLDAVALAVVHLGQVFDAALQLAVVLERHEHRAHDARVAVALQRCPHLAVDVVEVLDDVLGQHELLPERE